MSIGKVKIFNDKDGKLAPFNLKDIGFDVKRVFSVYDVPRGIERGNHAHYKTEQLLCCLKGSIMVRLFDGKEYLEKIINEGDSIYIPNLIWDSQIFMTGNDFLLSFCSTEYDKNDYINDIKEYIEIMKEKNG